MKDGNIGKLIRRGGSLVTVVRPGDEKKKFTVREVEALAGGVGGRGLTIVGGRFGQRGITIGGVHGRTVAGAIREHERIVRGRLRGRGKTVLGGKRGKPKVTRKRKVTPL